MSDIINKIITISLIFVLLVLSPLVISYMASDMTSQRVALNEVAQFLDQVKYKTSITQQDLDDLYLGINSSGGLYDVKVEKLLKLSTQNADNSLRSIYVSDDDLSVLNKENIIKVTVSEIGVTPTKRILWSLLRLDTGKFHFSLAVTIK